MLSIQTNVASLEAQQAITVNTNFQNNTIEQLSTGYRINSSADDAAGLAVANTYSSETTELTQGVLNANNGVAALQIVDGGTDNISQILNRLDTLATESASSTFAGNRETLNNEYQGLLAEINQQAANVNLNTGGSYNTVLTTYVGGGNDAANSQVSVDLSGASDAIDSTALGISTTSIAGGGTELTGNSVNLNNTAVSFLTNATQNFTFHLNTGTGNQTVTAGVTGGGSGLTGDGVVSQLNTTLQPLGITASIAADGTLAFSGSPAFTVTTSGAGAGEVTSNGVTSASNQANYGIATSGFTGFNNESDSAPDETIVFQNSGGSKTFDFNANSAPDINTAINNLNTALTGTGIYAVATANGNDISFQSSTSFSVVETAYTAAGATGVGSAFGGTVGAKAVAAPAATASPTANAIAALSLLQTAVTNLGLVQGKIGAGINKLTYATNLAQSQITNFSAAESGIRDADIAAEAANLTKAQVLQQASLAALAQANAAPQAVLSLLKNGQ